MAKHGWTTGHAHARDGARNYKLWVPARLEEGKPAPLLMLLHGCKVSAESMAEISGMNEVAEKNRFIAVYPEQRRRANLMKCWNWFNPRHQSRDAGEPAILAAIVEHVRTQYEIDSNRTYVAGISAGGAMAIIMGTVYADLFAGIAVCSGAEYKAATNAAQGFTTMKSGGPDPVRQGKLAYEAMQPALARRPRTRMPVIVFHGSADERVNPLNADQIVAQWKSTNECLASETGEGFSVLEREEPGSVADGYSYNKHIFTDQTGALLMEKWIVENLGHAWSGSPHAHKYGNPKGPRASEEIWRFFSEAGTHSNNRAGLSAISQVAETRSAP